jgi:hypothetical protein
MKLNRILLIPIIIIHFSLTFFSPLNASLGNPKAHLINPSSSFTHQPFVIFSPPKCGTHLVGKALSLMTNKKPKYYLSGIGSDTLDSLNLIVSEEAQDSFVVGHHFTNILLKILINRGYKIIFVIRDPRDQLISAINWIREGQWYWLPISKISNLHDQITEAITGSQYGWQSVEGNFLSFEQELDGISLKNIYKIHYEKLIGLNGKGTAEEQTNEILAIANFLGLTLSSKTLDDIADHLFGGTTTFRDGSIGKWKHNFTDEQKKQFKKQYNHLLIRLGYEKDSRW